MTRALDETLTYLESDEAAASLAADAYWPKWDSPWWRMLLLHELGLGEKIPERPLRAVVRALATEYLTTFPFRLEEVPPGKDPYRHVACHCQLGCMYQVLVARGVDVDREVPWIRPWFLRYQLPDGGLNCDEAAYTRPVPRSSFLSTLPPLEALLAAKGPRSPEEVAFLDRGARYLIERRLLRSLSKGTIADASWLEPTFPRFYDYDVLRGLSFLARWSRELGRELPADAIAEAVAHLEKIALPEGIPVLARAWQGVTTRWRDERGAWHGGKEARPARPFALLEEVSVIGAPSPALTRSWEEARLSASRARS